MCFVIFSSGGFQEVLAVWGVSAGEGPVPVPGLHLLHAPLRPGPPQGRHRQDHHVELDAVEPIYLITVVTGEGV